MSDPYAMFRALTTQLHTIAAMLEQPLDGLATSVLSIEDEHLRARMAADVLDPLLDLFNALRAVQAPIMNAVESLNTCLPEETE